VESTAFGFAGHSLWGSTTCLYEDRGRCVMIRVASLRNYSRWDSLYVTHGRTSDTLAILVQVVEHQVKGPCNSKLGAGYIGPGARHDKTLRCVISAERGRFFERLSQLK